jgi:hypothetical protein
MEIEAPYFDGKGREIKEYDLLQIYHFKGVNEQGRGRKHYYMYKWIRLREFQGKMWWIGLHMHNEDSHVLLKACASPKDRIIQDSRIIQTKYES